MHSAGEKASLDVERGGFSLLDPSCILARHILRCTHV